MPEPRVDVPVAVHDVPVGISWLYHHWLGLVLLVVGGMAALCALGVAAALVVTGLISVSWSVPGGVGLFH